MAQAGAYVECSWFVLVGLDGVVTLEAFSASGDSLGLTTAQTDGVGGLFPG